MSAVVGVDARALVPTSRLQESAAGDQRGYGTDFVEVRDGKMQTIVVFGDAGPPPTG